MIDHLMLALAGWIVSLADRGVPLPSRALPWARERVLAEMFRYQNAPAPEPGTRPAVPPPRPPAYPPPAPPKPRPPSNAEPPPLVARAALATQDQIDRYEQAILTTFALGLLAYKDARQRLAALAVPSLPARALQDACSGLLLDLANLGQDDLYEDVRRLEEELAGERATSAIDLRSRTFRVARGAA